MKDHSTSPFQDALLCAAAALLCYLGGYLFPWSEYSGQSSVLVFMTKFFAPIMIMILGAFSFVVFTSLRHDLIAVTTGIACHFGAIPKPGMFWPLTLTIFVGVALIAAAIGRDIRKRIERKRQASPSNR